MKKTIVLAFLAITISGTLALVDSPNTNNSELSITQGSSASATTAVGPNGTQWSSSAEMSGTSANITQGDRVANTSFQENKTLFTGYIRAPNPCHVIDQETEKINDQKYRMNIKTQIENPEQVCTQQLVMIKYNGSFEAQTPYTLEIQHNNQSINTLKHPENNQTEPNTSKKRNTLSSFINWIRNLL